jgi:hypothetical protein
LTALNVQLQEALERQRATSNDLQNVLYSTDVAMILLDTDLNIRFFTPITKPPFSIVPLGAGGPPAALSSLAATQRKTQLANAQSRDSLSMRNIPVLKGRGDPHPGRGEAS